MTPTRSRTTRATRLWSKFLTPPSVSTGHADSRAARAMRSGSPPNATPRPATSPNEEARRLPDLHPIRRREIELPARLEAEGFVPGVEVPDGVGAVLVGRVAVDHEALAQCRLPDL